MNLRNRYFLLFDTLLVLLSVAVSFSLRFDTLNAWDYLTENWFFAPLLLLIRLPLFYAFGLYRRLWRYASVNEFVAIGEAVLLGSAIDIAAVLVFLAPLGLIGRFPRSVVLIESMLTLLFVGGIRFSFRLSGHKRSSQRVEVFERRSVKKRVLIFGAGDAGALIVRELRANPELGLEPIAFLDDDIAKKGLRIHDVPVMGERSDLEEIVQAQQVDAVIIAMPTAPGRVIREITELCRQVGMPVKTMPGLYEILGGSVKVSAIREVQLEDLLRREPVTIDLAQVGQYLGKTRVLVTGAGGSIGSELCRQIARFNPERLILFELAENNLYQIHRELVEHFPSVFIAPIVGDVRDPSKVERIFSQQRPQVIFHAAAHKHVPLMESNVDEVISNNVFGTLNVLQASARHKVQRFVFISTDKAVNPSSVMGAAKRIGEMLITSAAEMTRSAKSDGLPDSSSGPNTLCTAVRFGNVLGSSGSVVPLFKEQVAVGGPVTVTHPDVQRYFMTIPEAVNLIIQAAALGKNAEIFVLDMGEPVRINDLATDVIRLSGLELGDDIEIAYIGLRPGEKLIEELFTASEQPQPTQHPRILVAKADRCDAARLRRDLAELQSLLQTYDVAKIKAKLKEIVPEYAPEGR